MIYLIDLYIFGKDYKGKITSTYMINTYKNISKEEMKGIILGIQAGFNVNNNKKLEDYDEDFKVKLLTREIGKIIDDDSLYIKILSKDNPINLEVKL